MSMLPLGISLNNHDEGQEFLHQVVLFVGDELGFCGVDLGGRLVF